MVTVRKFCCVGHPVGRSTSWIWDGGGHVLLLSMVVRVEV
jgi:hypothetical protein